MVVTGMVCTPSLPCDISSDLIMKSKPTHSAWPPRAQIIRSSTLCVNVPGDKLGRLEREICSMSSQTPSDHQSNSPRFAIGRLDIQKCALRTRKGPLSPKQLVLMSTNVETLVEHRSKPTKDTVDKILLRRTR